MGDRPNSEFIISPEGKIIVKRAWSHPAATRQDLEKLVGKPGTLTSPKDLKLKITLPSSKSVRDQGSGTSDRQGMLSLQCNSLSPKEIHYAKLRAEATQKTLRERKGKLYLGFHLDPLYGAKWNNLSSPLSYSIQLPPEVTISKSKGVAETRASTYDTEAREFLLDIDQWLPNAEVIITVDYSICIDKECIPVQHRYQIRLERDRDGGSARSQRAGGWNSKEFVTRLLRGDKNNDGKLNREEVMGLIRPHFSHFDVDSNQLLDSKELQKVVDWLNHPEQGIEMQIRKSRQDATSDNK